MTPPPPPPPPPPPASSSGSDKRRSSEGGSVGKPIHAEAGGGGVIDRRTGIDRRDLAPATDPSGLERRRGPGRRLTDFMKSAEEGEMNREQFLFLVAIDAFKRANQTTFPAWTDVLEVIRLLGYRKTCQSALNLPSAEDWTEKADAPHGVRTKRGDDEDR